MQIIGLTHLAWEYDRASTSCLDSIGRILKTKEDKDLYDASYFVQDNIWDDSEPHIPTLLEEQGIKVLKEKIVSKKPKEAVKTK